MRKKLLLLITLTALLTLGACSKDNTCENPQETDVDGECLIVIDQELLNAIEEVIVSLETDDNTLELGISDVYERDSVWLGYKVTYYTMLKEIVLNGYAKGEYINVNDFLDEPTRWLSDRWESMVKIDLENDELVSQILKYNDDKLTDLAIVETFKAEFIGETSDIKLMIVEEHIDEFIYIQDYSDVEGLVTYTIPVDDYNSTYYRVGFSLDDSTNVISKTIDSLEIEYYKQYILNYYTTNNELSLKVYVDFPNLNYYYNNTILERILSKETLEYGDYYEIIQMEYDKTVSYMAQGNTLKLDIDKLTDIMTEFDVINEMIEEYMYLYRFRDNLSEVSSEAPERYQELIDILSIPAVIEGIEYPILEYNEENDVYIVVTLAYRYYGMWEDKIDEYNNLLTIEDENMTVEDYEDMIDILDYFIYLLQFDTSLFVYTVDMRPYIIEDYDIYFHQVSDSQNNLITDNQQIEDDIIELLSYDYSNFGNISYSTTSNEEIISILDAMGMLYDNNK